MDTIETGGVWRSRNHKACEFPGFLKRFQNAEEARCRRVILRPILHFTSCSITFQTFQGSLTSHQSSCGISSGRPERSRSLPLTLNSCLRCIFTIEREVLIVCCWMHEEVGSCALQPYWSPTTLQNEMTRIGTYQLKFASSSRLVNEKLPLVSCTLCLPFKSRHCN